MSHCCSNLVSETQIAKTRQCPRDGVRCHTVSATTIKHHIKKAWAWVAKDQAYYFCANPDCDVIYFGEDDVILDITALRTEVGIKQSSELALVCYCYGVTKHEAVNNPEAYRFILRETKQKHCASETRNPSGSCCLADIKRLRKTGV